MRSKYWHGLGRSFRWPFFWTLYIKSLKTSRLERPRTPTPSDHVSSWSEILHTVSYQDKVSLGRGKCYFEQRHRLASLPDIEFDAVSGALGVKRPTTDISNVFTVVEFSQFMLSGIEGNNVCAS